MKKRIMAHILALCLALSLLPTTALAAELDLDPTIGSEFSEWPEEVPVENVPEIPNEDFYLYDDALDAGFVARGAWIADLVRLFGLTVDEYPDVYFPDIEGTPYFDAIMTATMCGMVDVEAGDDFDPNGPLTRDFAAHTLNYLLGLQPNGNSYTFNDSGDTEYPDDAQAVVDAGWLTLLDGKFLPSKP